MTMTKTERNELRTIVRQQFRVLREELRQRQSEMYSAVEDQVVEKFKDWNKAWDDLMFGANEAALEANRKVNDLLHQLGFNVKDGTEAMYVRLNLPPRPVYKEQSYRMQLQTKVNAKVTESLLRLSRQEADMLRNLAEGALETDEAKAFLAQIPTVGELVSVDRLKELEASLGKEEEWTGDSGDGF